MNQTLIDAVTAQLNCDDDELNSTMSDIASHGADAGFSGFIYHSETCQFARDNMAAIYRQIKDDAEDFGTDPLELVAGFRCLNGEFPAYEIASVIHDDRDDATRNDGAETSILNALAWYSLEFAAHSFDN
tara:strand:- start:203 stop:592 length:390 start_codon:yes stop_codon:yes gene_type:complete